MMKFIFTCGDINGIGPEIVIKAINSIYKRNNSKLFLAIPANIFLETSKIVKPIFNYKFEKTSSSPDTNPDVVTIFDLGKASQKLGQPTEVSGEIAYKSILFSFDYLNKWNLDGMITAPISKDAFNKAGVKYKGHTDLLADLTNSKDVVMMFLSKKMKAALITIHIPIKDVSRSITRKSLLSKIEIVIRSLKKDFAIDNPKIAVLGLNPHAGEKGVIGNEESNIIQPIINSQPNLLYGAFSPDAFFANRNYEIFDVVIGMYHDQLLIPFKMIDFKTGVNFSAGLPIIRTSPDHGVAYDIAGTNQASSSSLFNAFKYAYKIAKNRKMGAEH